MNPKDSRSTEASASNVWVASSCGLLRKSVDRDLHTEMMAIMELPPVLWGRGDEGQRSQTSSSSSTQECRQLCCDGRLPLHTRRSPHRADFMSSSSCWFHFDAPTGFGFTATLCALRETPARLMVAGPPAPGSFWSRRMRACRWDAQMH